MRHFAALLHAPRPVVSRAACMTPPVRRRSVSWARVRNFVHAAAGFAGCVLAGIVAGIGLLILLVWAALAVLWHLITEGDR